MLSFRESSTFLEVAIIVTSFSTNSIRCSIFSSWCNRSSILANLRLNHQVAVSTIPPTENTVFKSKLCSSIKPPAAAAIIAAVDAIIGNFMYDVD